MNIYLASGFRQRDKLRELAQQLHENGHWICSSWLELNERPERDSESWDEFAEKIAGANYVDMLLADCLVIDADGIAPDNNGGVHTELGIALARDIQIYLVGKRGNTFHWMPCVRVVEDYDELFRSLTKLF